MKVDDQWWSNKSRIDLEVKPKAKTLVSEMSMGKRKITYQVSQEMC